MNILNTMANLWNELILIGIGSYLLVILFGGITTIMVERLKIISATLWGILTVIFSIICRVSFTAGIALGLMKLFLVLL